MPYSQDPLPSFSRRRGKASILAIIALIGLSLGIAASLPWLFWFNQKSGFYGLESVYTVNGRAPWLDRVLSEAPDHYHYLMFGFLSCTDTCPTQLTTLISLRGLLHNERARFVYITLDPERDSAETLAYISQQLGPEFRFVRPESLSQAQQATQAFRDFAARQSNSLDIQHSGRLYLISPDRSVRLVYSPQQNDPFRLSKDFFALANISTTEEPDS